MQKAGIVLGLNGRNLKDLDTFSKSDPYVVVSRQGQPGGPWVPVRTSETVNNNLNPDWKEFLIYEAELGSGSSDDLQIEVFDDDGKPGKDRNDQSIGFVQTRVSQLKAGLALTLRDRRHGAETGRVEVRSFRRTGGEAQAASAGYPAPAGAPQPAAGGQAAGFPALGYPHPPATGSYSAPGGYPAPPTTGYPAPPTYPVPNAGGYPPAAGYPPASGYPPSAGYPPAAGYPAGSMYPGGPVPAPGAGLYPSVPPPASAGLPYPVQPGPGMVHGAPGAGPAPKTGLLGQMQGMVRPQGPGAGGFRLP